MNFKNIFTTIKPYCETCEYYKRDFKFLFNSPLQHQYAICSRTGFFCTTERTQNLLNGIFANSCTRHGLLFKHNPFVFVTSDMQIYDHCKVPFRSRK